MMIKSNLLSFIAILVCLNSISIIDAQSPVATASTPFPTPKLLDHDDFGISYYPLFEGLHLHIRCYKNSNITNGDIVLFDSGLPFYSTAWGLVLGHLVPKMSDFGIQQACFVDRFGYGNSDPAPNAITSHEFIRRLRASLLIIDLQPPYIYVGWSWASINAQTFAIMYPNEIKGMLTVDGSDVGLLQDPIWNFNIPFIQNEFTNLISINSNGGLQTLAENGGVPETLGWIPNSAPLPQICIQNSQATFTHPSNNYLIATKQEISVMMDSADYLNQTYVATENPHPFGNLPFVLISVVGNGQDWIDRQTTMASLSTNHYQILNTQSSHFVPFERPTDVVDAIGALVDLIGLSPNVEMGCTKDH